MRLSKSSVNCYTQCPYRFYLEYIKKVPRKTTSSALIKGTEVHDLMDMFYDPDVNTITQAEALINLNPLMKPYKKVMSNFIKFNREILSEGSDILIKPLFKEIKLYDPETNISGIIDVIHKDDKRLVLIDYKTGKEHPIAKFRFELALYTYLFEKLYRMKITHWGIYFVDTDKFKVEQKDYKEIDKSLKKVEDTRIMINAESFDKKPSYLCKWCNCFNGGFCNARK